MSVRVGWYFDFIKVTADSAAIPKCLGPFQSFWECLWPYPKKSLTTFNEVQFKNQTENFKVKPSNSAIQAYTNLMLLC